MRTGLEALWREAMRPSGPDEGPYQFTVIAIGHAMIGAALSWGGLPVAALYWLVKERNDLRRGGCWRDGMIDTGFVALGTFYSGPFWWPILVIVLAVAGAAAGSLEVNLSNDRSRASGNEDKD